MFLMQNRRKKTALELFWKSQTTILPREDSDV